MVMDAVVERFVEQSPITVMARLALRRVLDPVWLDALFERGRHEQYKGNLLLSTTVEMMSLVAVWQRPSLHAAAQACTDFPVSVQEQYGKINRTEPSRL